MSLTTFAFKLNDKLKMIKSFASADFTLLLVIFTSSFYYLHFDSMGLSEEYGNYI